MIRAMTLKQYLFGLAILLLLLGLFVYLPLHTYPEEDAAILFQFSENLAQSGAITYNLSGAHAEGATDFLWMVLLGFMHYIGFNTFFASTILSMFALIGTAYLLFKITNTNNINYFLLLVVFLILLPMTPAAIQGFSSLFFGFFITLAAYHFINNNSHKLFVSGLLLCLVRPDGIVVAAPLIILFIICNRSNFNENVKELSIYCLFPGLIYFIWRWSYFGEFLPLPFYVKSNFDRDLLLFNLNSLKLNLKIVVVIFSPTIIFIIGSLYRDKVVKNATALLVAIVFSPFVFYSAMELSQNISYRFQYSMVLGLLVVSSYVLNSATSKRFLLIIFVSQILFMLPKSGIKYFSMLAIPTQQNTYIAKELNRITTDASMAITEAGRLPYYSKWNAIDTWGLNTPKYAKKLIQPNDIRAENPDLIVVHAFAEDYSSLVNPADTPVFKKRTWANMTSNIFKGINMASYTLYMVPFSHHNSSSFISNFFFIVSSIERSYMNRGEPNTAGMYMRYDAYFIKNSFRHSQDVKELLLNHHAISFEEFMEL